MKIYVPNKENYKCFVVRSEEVIRAYEEVPRNIAEEIIKKNGAK